MRTTEFVWESSELTVLGRLYDRRNWVSARDAAPVERCREYIETGCPNLRCRCPDSNGIRPHRRTVCGLCLAEAGACRRCCGGVGSRGRSDPPLDRGVSAEDRCEREVGGGAADGIEDHPPADVGFPSARWRVRVPFGDADVDRHGADEREDDEWMREPDSSTGNAPSTASRGRPTYIQARPRHGVDERRSERPLELTPTMNEESRCYAVTSVFE
jgi:hypothetical protein